MFLIFKPALLTLMVMVMAIEDAEQWNELQIQSEEIPPKRYSHSAVMIADAEMLIFGGYYSWLSESHNFNDLWKLSITSTSSSSLSM